MVRAKPPSPEIAVARVALRVAQGGHNIPEAVIRRRYASGLKNFENVYQGLVSSWLRFDNTALLPRLLDWRE